MRAGQEEFFAIIGEGAALLKNLDEDSSGFFDDLNRLREILAMLGYSAALKPLDFSLADKEGSAKALTGYLESGIAALPAELAVFEAQTVRDLALLIGNAAVADHARYMQTVGGQEASRPEAKITAFANIAARGVKHGIPQEVLDKALTDADELLAQKLNDNPAYKQARAEYDQLNLDVNERIKALDLKVRDARDAVVYAVRDRKSEAECTELRAKREALAAELDALYNSSNAELVASWERLKAAQATFNDERVAAHRALFEDNGAAILSKIAESSPVTPEAAQAWANEQIIDDNARAKLKRLGYKPEDVLRDMAEFYRLVGGKASAIRIGIDGGRRANAVGVTDRLGEKVINLGARFNKTVLFHELAHHLENDPIANAASNGFLLKRREGEQVYRLRDLTNCDYDKREVAYKDHFIDPYVGKVYQNGVTEVFSMGVQYLANPKDAAILAAKDPEMFALITGYLTMPATPAMHAKLNMHKSAIGQMLERKQEVETQYERAIEFLSARAAVTQDDWFDTLDKGGGLYDLMTRYILAKGRKGPVQYVGAHGQYKVFSGVFRNWETKRNAKGYLILDAASYTGDSIPHSIIVHGDMEKVQALIAVASLEGGNLDTARNYFLNNSEARKQKLIEAVGAENLK